ncbi:MAG: aspartate aminotransferase family protein [Cyclobacteriaceae bacterium]
MKLFDVYSLLPIEPVRALGSKIWDANGQEYLDLYGGHAVISVGHSHPKYNAAIQDQLNKISFYSNSVQNKLQEELAEKLGALSGYNDYSLFLCNSGAEANENALKLASFITGKRKIIAMKKAFHGRTSGAVAATDNPKIIAPFNAGHEIIFVPMNDASALDAALDDQVAAILIEGIQGVAGIFEPQPEYLQHLEKRCQERGVILILDEVQSGYGRTGKFFAHQHAGIRPHLIATAKGMGNGFPIGGVLIHPDLKPWSGMLGTTFGGNHLACAAGIAVLDIIKEERLMENAETIGTLLIEKITSILQAPVRGKGLMIGFDTPEHHLQLRTNLISKHRIFTGEAKPAIIRLLPSLALSKQDAELFLSALDQEIHQNATA